MQYPGCRGGLVLPAPAQPQSNILKALKNQGIQEYISCSHTVNKTNRLIERIYKHGNQRKS